MDLRQLEYILKIAEVNNVTKAAEQLFISQSALNQQLLKLEKELGSPLFYRTRNNWKLTEVGEVYIENAKQIMAIRQNTYNQISDIINRRSRQFTMGLIPSRGADMFASVYSRFLKLFPDISISTMEIGSLRQQSMIADGKLSLGFMTLCPQQRISKLRYYPVYSEEFFVVVPPAHPLSHPGQGLKNPPEIDITLLKDDAFVFMDKASSSRLITDNVFRSTGIQPRILFETSNARSIPRFVLAGLCCTVIPLYYLTSLPPADLQNITIFSLPSHPSWDMVFATSEHYYLSKPLREFISMSQEYWASYYSKLDL